MWYFTWALGVGFAVAFGILNGMWGELEDERYRRKLEDRRREHEKEEYRQEEHQESTIS